MKTRSEAEVDEQIQELKTITRLQGEFTTSRGPACLALPGPSLGSEALTFNTGPVQGKRGLVATPSRKQTRRDQRGCHTGGLQRDV